MHGLTAYFLQYENNLGNAQEDQDLKQNNQGLVHISINLSFTTKTSTLFCRRDVMKQKLLFQHVVGYMQPQSSREQGLPHDTGSLAKEVKTSGNQSGQNRLLISFFTWTVISLHQQTRHGLGVLITLLDLKEKKERITHGTAR